MKQGGAVLGAELTAEFRSGIYYLWFSAATLDNESAMWDFYAFV